MTIFPSFDLFINYSSADHFVEWIYVQKAISIRRKLTPAVDGAVMQMATIYFECQNT